jgi:hypothetical protein
MGKAKGDGQYATPAKLLGELERAKTAFDGADRKFTVARKLQSETLTRLNEAQRKFDEATTDMHKTAPVDSRWQRQMPG